MSGVQLDWYVFNVKDLDTERYLCRVCSKPSTLPKRYYCSDKCNNLLNHALLWNWVRNRIYNRDKRTCQHCRKKLRSYHCHHLVPVAYIMNQIFFALQGVPEEKWLLRYTQLKSIFLFHDDNLITLCEKCHKLAHKTGWYDKFKPIKQIKGDQKTLLNYTTNAVKY